jgi:glycosyltransferase involved in cell wall biosynthesis
MSVGPGSPWLIIAGDFSRHGGMDRANYELARHIAQERLGELHLVAHRVSEPLLSMPGVTFHQVPRPGGRDIFGALLLARHGRKIAKQVKTSPLRVIVNGGNCRWPGANWVHYLHDAFRANNRGVPFLYRLKNGINRFANVQAEKKSLAASRLIFVNSQRTADDVGRFLGQVADRIHVVYYGVDPACHARAGESDRLGARARLGLETATEIVLFLGGIGFDQRKGFDVALRAFQLLSGRRKRKAQLLVIGPGQIDYWQHLADPTAQRVRLVGPRQDVPDWLAAADLLISPTRYEAYGMAVHEALCRGLPVIVSRSAGVAERYPEELSELTLPDPEDAVDLCQRMELALDHRSRLQPAIDAFADRLRRWTWDDMASAMVRLIDAQS